MTKFWIAFFALSLFLLSCQTTPPATLEGEMYFKGVDLRLFEAPDSFLMAVENDVNALFGEPENEEVESYYRLVESMIEANLLREPYIRIKDSLGTVNMLFLNEEEYDLFRELTWPRLVSAKKKVMIKAEVRPLAIDTFSVYRSEKLVNFQLVDGNTERMGLDEF